MLKIGDSGVWPSEALSERVTSFVLMTSTVLRVIATLVGVAYNSVDIRMEDGYVG